MVYLCHPDRSVPIHGNTMIYITKVGYRKYRVGVDLYVAMDDKVKHNLQVGHAQIQN